MGIEVAIFQWIQDILRCLAGLAILEFLGNLVLQDILTQDMMRRIRGNRVSPATLEIPVFQGGLVCQDSPENLDN